jgi:hypothetical protein
VHGILRLFPTPRADPASLQRLAVYPWRDETIVGTGSEDRENAGGNFSIVVLAAAGERLTRTVPLTFPRWGWEPDGRHSRAYAAAATPELIERYEAFDPAVGLGVHWTWMVFERTSA